ncbi:MAG TPA: GNAT family N-acetyltransferase [Rhizomicrobium sp.]|nr:GNAT family N-acetyltransferase [Rhizomicrobium sp.]
MSVVRLGPEDAEDLRDIRLEALRLHPTAFSADPDVESAFTLERWREGLKSRVWFGGRVAGVLAGINAFSIDGYSKKVAHIGHLGAMYVRAGARGTGLADALMKNFLDYAVGKVEQVELTVEAGNAVAVKLYERHGFRTVGKMPRSIRIGDVFYDELQMYRLVSSSD